MTDLEELKRLAVAAAPGPWRVDTNKRGIVRFNADDTTGFLIGLASNAAFIAAANPATILSLIERVERAEADVLFTLSYQARLVRKEDVAGVCLSPDICFEYGPVRCEPCAVKASALKGVKIEYRRSQLPEVCRLKRENKDAEKRGYLRGLEEAAKAANQAWLDGVPVAEIAQAIRNLANPQSSSIP